MMSCYCRVSSRSQKTDSQKTEIIHWLQQQGVALTAVRWFEDIERGLPSDGRRLRGCNMRLIVGRSRPSSSGSSIGWHAGSKTG
jgi:hypothetical protein